MNKILEGISEEERVRSMDDTCYRKVQEKFYQPIVSDEIEEIKNELLNAYMKLSDLEAEKKEVIEEINERIKPYKKEVKELTSSLKQGAREVEDILWYMDDQEEGLMYLYDRFGNLIKSRKLLPSERQGVVRNNLKIS